MPAKTQAAELKAPKTLVFCSQLSRSDTKLGAPLSLLVPCVVHRLTDQVNVGGAQLLSYCTHGQMMITNVQRRIGIGSHH